MNRENFSDKVGVYPTTQSVETQTNSFKGWSIQMRAISMDEPAGLVETLAGAILGCGGWILSRGADTSGIVNVIFEFERRACIDIYSVLVAAGIELSQSGHIRLTELCQCTRFHSAACTDEVACIDLEIQTFSNEVLNSMKISHAV